MIETERLTLRRWRLDDVVPFFAMGQDPEVMQHIGPPMSMADCRDAAERMNATANRTGSCFWAMERRSDHAFIGFCGIKPGPADTPIAGLAEIGWRLARGAWGKGYAREAAQACLEDAWAHGFDRVWAITVPANERSWGLMIRLGMTREPDGDFDHPFLPADHRLSQHLTYSVARP